MCRCCVASGTEQIRIALHCMGYTFANDNMATSLDRMEKIDTFIKSKVCKNWKRVGAPCYMNAARSMGLYQYETVDQILEETPFNQSVFKSVVGKIMKLQPMAQQRKVESVAARIIKLKMGMD